MAKTETRAWFTLYGSLDAQAVTRKLGLLPAKTWCKGDRVDDRLSIRRRENGWEYASPISKSGTINEHFEALIDIFYPRRAALAEITCEHDVQAVLCAEIGTNEGNPSVGFVERLTVQRIGELGCALNIDILTFPEDDNW